MPRQDCDCDHGLHVVVYDCGLLPEVFGPFKTGIDARDYADTIQDSSRVRVVPLSAPEGIY